MIAEKRDSAGNACYSPLACPEEVIQFDDDLHDELSPDQAATATKDVAKS